MLVPSLSFASGLNWYRQSLLLIAKNPKALIGFSIMSGMLFKILFNMSILTLFLALFLMPFLSVGMMNICREIEGDRQPSFHHFFQVFKENTQGIILLTFLSMLVTSIFLYALMFIVGRPVFFVLLEKAPPAAMPLSDWSLPEFLSILFFIFITMAFWFAPVLISWYRFSVIKSFFFSLIACLRNWQALLAYLVPLMLLFFALSYVPEEGVLATFVSLFMLLLGTPWLQACFYVSFRSIFIEKSE